MLLIYRGIGILGRCEQKSRTSEQEVGRCEQKSLTSEQKVDRSEQKRQTSGQYNQTLPKLKQEGILKHTYKWILLTNLFKKDREMCLIYFKTKKTVPPEGRTASKNVLNV